MVYSVLTGREFDEKRLYKANFSAIIAGVMTAALFSGCNSSTESEDKETTSVYLLSTERCSRGTTFLCPRIMRANTRFSR